jgi:hypothetical protein
VRYSKKELGVIKLRQDRTVAGMNIYFNPSNKNLKKNLKNSFPDFEETTSSSVQRRTSNIPWGNKHC